MSALSSVDGCPDQNLGRIYGTFRKAKSGSNIEMVTAALAVVHGRAESCETDSEKSVFSEVSPGVDAGMAVDRY
jgi:hypothetical protein